MNTSSAPQGTQSVVRALRLLKLFHGASELSSVQVRARVDLNRTTVLRLLGALEAEGMLVRDGGRDLWRLGPQIAALGRRAAGRGDLPELARAELDLLAAKVHETVTLEVLGGAEVTVVAEALGSYMLAAVPSVGTCWPAHATSTGKIMLAALARDEREGLLAGRLRRLTERTLTSRAELSRELERVQRQGWATNLEELEPGYAAIAVPVLDAGGRVVAALSVGGPRQRMPRPRLRELASTLARSSARITRQLGG